jgi:type II secretion system protein J
MKIDPKNKPFVCNCRYGLDRASPPLLRRKNACAFTLVEILITLIIGAMIAIIALAGYHTVSTLRHRIMFRSQRQAELRYALNRIRDDLANFYRGGQIDRMVLLGEKMQTDAGRSDRLMFQAVFDPPFRPVYPAGDLYQIEYALSSAPPTNQNVLSRRAGALFSTAPPELAVAADRLTGRIKSLQFDYFYQDVWYDQWTRTDAIPMMIRVTLVAEKTDQGDEETQPMTRVISLEPFPKQQRQPESAGSTPTQAPTTNEQPNQQP